MQRETFNSFDGKSISVAIWQNNANPKGIVQILHGLAEHIARYDDFASFLAENGFIVVGDDHRGHGETDRDSLGLARGGDSFEDTVKDALAITEQMSIRFNLPVVVLGHSYGSFLTRRYIALQNSDVVRGYILSGTSHVAGLQLGFGRFLTRSKSRKNADKPAKLIIAQSFKKYDKKTKEGKNDWLCTDAQQVGKYNIDPFCGFSVSYGFYKSFFDGIARINKTDKQPAKTPQKILIASGASDLFGGSGKLVKKVHDIYKNQGHTTSLKLYENARHEILNEKNKQQVYNDMLDFANSTLTQE